MNALEEWDRFIAECTEKCWNCGHMVKRLSDDGVCEECNPTWFAENPDEDEELQA